MDLVSEFPHTIFEVQVTQKSSHESTQGTALLISHLDMSHSNKGLFLSQTLFMEAGNHYLPCFLFDCGALPVSHLEFHGRNCISGEKKEVGYGNTYAQEALNLTVF